MTFREKAILLKVEIDYMNNIPIGCPHKYKLEKIPYCFLHKISCHECWDRSMPSNNRIIS